LYGTLFYEDNNNDYHSGLYEIDKSTGMATLIGAGHTDEYSLCAVSPGASQNITDETIDRWNVYPNPVNDFMHIKMTYLPDKIELIDISGKVIETVYPAQLQVSMDVSRLSPGTYWLRLYKEGHYSAKAVIVK
jgi:hypothetical protein